MFKLHETLNSFGVLISIALWSVTVYFDWEKDKENIAFRTNIENGDFKSKITQNIQDRTSITLKYNVLIINSGYTSTSVVGLKTYHFTRHERYTDYAVSSDPINRPISLPAGNAEIVRLEVEMPLSAHCSHGIEIFGKSASFSSIMKFFGEREKCLSNIFELYSLAAYDGTYYPNTRHSNEVYTFYPPILFQLETARGKIYSQVASAFSVGFRNGDARVVPH